MKITIELKTDELKKAYEAYYGYKHESKQDLVNFVQDHVESLIDDLLTPYTDQN